MRFLLSIAVLLITIHRLPAPVSEIPETPTPMPAPTQSANRQLHPGERWRSPEPKITARPQPSPKPTPTQTVQHGPGHFVGIWTGKLKFGIEGQVQFMLTVNPDATSLEQKSKAFGEHTYTTSYTAQTLSWTAGSKNEIAWTLTPSRDGQTASVTRSGPETNSVAIFHRVQPNPSPPWAKSPPKQHPGTKLKRPGY